MIFDFAVIGGGILGLTSALALARVDPDARILVLEKEARWAAHQTGRNSGVIHSGIYYRPGSLKATLTREGVALLTRFCDENDVRYEICGKVIVAVTPEEIPRLDTLQQRGAENGLVVTRLSGEQLRGIEPHARGVAALHVPATGIVNYGEVAGACARLLGERHGAILQTGAEVTRIVRSDGGEVTLHTRGGEAFTARFLVNCAGLHSDRIARLDGLNPNLRIVPFRGEYYELTPQKRSLVRHLIYPVPDPAFPFLGVHFTRMTDGSVHAGPNAVLSMKREGYTRRDVSLRDMAEVFGDAAFWRLARAHTRMGLEEIARSLSKARFVRSLQRLIPDVSADDLTPAASGVRAQALGSDGRLLDDFAILTRPGAVHVCNAPSPAATASFAIGRVIAARVAEQRG